MKSEQFISIFFIAVLFFVVYQVYTIFSVFFNAILGGSVLAFVVYPLYDFLKKKTKHETLSAVMVTIAVFFLVIPPLMMLVVNLAAQVIELSQSAYNFARDGKMEQLIDQIRNYGWVQKVENQIVQWDLLKENLANWAVTTAKEIGNVTATQLASFTRNAFFIILNTFFMIFLVFIFLKDGQKIYDFIYQAAPFKEETKATIFEQITGTFSAVIRGQIMTSFAQSFVAGCFYFAVGIPAYLFFAVLTFITSMIPIGAAGVWLPLALYLFFKGFIIQGIILGIGGIIVSCIDNFIKPLVIGEKTQLPFFLLLFGILGGLAVYGFIGVFLAPVVISLFFALVKIYKAEYLNNE